MTIRSGGYYYMNFKFTKWHGCGNDFVIINGLEENIETIQPQAAAICNRNFGIGADGVITVCPSENADFCMRIFNSDGSEAEMCGNGIRCFARYVYEAKLTTKSEMTIETKAGIMKPKIIASGDDVLVTVNMGNPVLQSDKVPVAGFADKTIISEEIIVDNENFHITCVSMGNPHCIIFVDDINAVDINKWGPVLEKHQIFPNKTNVEFVQVLNRSKLRMRVWERGAAITLACGTGACATLVAGVLNNLCDRQASLQLDGGLLSIEWNESDNNVYMTGPATKVFEGKYSG